MNQENIKKQNVGNAGEYYIASRLSALDFTVTITLGRAEKYDLLALSPNEKLIKISVKTTQLENAIDFPLSVKDESGQSDDFYYAFVKLNKFNKEPDFWIIPSKVACPIIKNSNEIWLKTLGKNNKPHQDSTMRLLPIKVRDSQMNLYPKNWNEKVKTYYKNLKQLL
ncbi:MAG TPA: group I intron-associated PD-(D/E)XK endonuclease [Candidatus Woesebacteria bacterium]|nr:group I intron-associated PD-(D/E)XK endonuclease [Candidatus Woesebacteria bacterium]